MKNGKKKKKKVNGSRRIGPAVAKRLKSDICTYAYIYVCTHIYDNVYIYSYIYMYMCTSNGYQRFFFLLCRNDKSRGSS